jgi:hypothetical protein
MIERYESKRMRLYTDIPADKADPLPALADQLFEALQTEFGELLPDWMGVDFQVTAYLIKDEQKFVRHNLIKDAIAGFRHGQHLGYQFWMYEQEFDYYRRHLLLHEFTHCFMLSAHESMGGRPPLWYLEGMAEIFGTHHLDEKGRLTFGIMPARPDEVVGLGRIEMVQHAIARGDFHSLSDVLALNGKDFTVSRSDPYAWSWALCHFLRTHPRYNERFRQLNAHLADGQFASRFKQLYAKDYDRLAWEWEWFAADLRHGSDVVRNQIDFDAPPAGKPFEVAAAASWRSSGVSLKEGQTVQIRATGRVTLNKTTKPWISEPQGITIEYEKGRPIGQLTAWILPDGGTRVAHPDRIETFAIGADGQFKAARAGLLFLGVNDHPNDRANNSGSYEVTLSPD